MSDCRFPCSTVRVEYSNTQYSYCTVGSDIISIDGVGIGVGLARARARARAFVGHCRNGRSLTCCCRRMMPPAPTSSHQLLSPSVPHRPLRMTMCTMYCTCTEPYEYTAHCTLHILYEYCTVVTVVYDSTVYSVPLCCAPVNTILYSTIVLQCSLLNWYSTVQYTIVQPGQTYAPRPQIPSLYAQS